jgi:hypothetical protein
LPKKDRLTRSALPTFRQVPPNFDFKTALRGTTAKPDKPEQMV